MRCAVCGATLSPLWPEEICPACRQGVRRESAAEELGRAEEFLLRIRQDGHPELSRIAASTRARVEKLRKRADTEWRDGDGGTGNQAAG